MKFALILLAAVTLPAAAQVRKCTLPDGKVVYSDVVCTDIAAKESRVRTNANVFDGSGVRAQAARSEASSASAAAAAAKPVNSPAQANVDAAREKARHADAEKACLAMSTYSRMPCLEQLNRGR